MIFVEGLTTVQKYATLPPTAEKFREISRCEPIARYVESNGKNQPSGARIVCAAGLLRVVSRIIRRQGLLSSIHPLAPNDVSANARNWEPGTSGRVLGFRRFRGSKLKGGHTALGQW